MKLPLLKLPQNKTWQKSKILLCLDKRFLIALVYWLFVILQTLPLLWRENSDYTKIFINILFFTSTFYYYYQRRYQLKFPSRPPAQIFGLILLSLVLFKLPTLRNGEVSGFLSVASPIVFLNITLLAAGFYGFRQFRRFWVVYFVVVWSFFLRDPWVGRSESWLTVISAKISSFFLWYLGFNSSTQGDFVYVNNGIIEIYNGCTLTPLFFVSIDLLVILYVFYPISRKRRDFVVACLLAFGLAFVLSIVRLAIMALVVNDPVKFEFWHGSQGSNLFMTICLVGCGLFALGRMPEDKSRPDPKPQNPLPALAKQEWTIRGCLLAFAIILLFLMLQPNGLAKPLANFEFPEKIPLTEWQVKTSKPLSVEEMGFFVELEAEKQISDLEQAVEKAQKEQVGSNILMSGRHYDLDRAGTSSQMILSYVLNSDATFPLLGNVDFSRSTYERLVEKTDVDAPYLIVDGKNKVHLVSCLMNGGQSVVTGYAVLRSHRIRHMLSNPETIYQWMNGQRLLHDRRCLWVHLSAGSTTPAVDYHLVQIWKALQKYWQKSYPSL